MTRVVAHEFDQAGAGGLEDGDSRAQGGEVLYGIEPIRGEQRIPELGWQRGSALNPAQDSMCPVIGQQAKASVFN
jgi:hypothetical protein